MQAIIGQQRSIRALISAAVLSFVATAPSWSQSLTWLGVLPGGRWSEAWDVSADGSVVVGTSDSANGRRAFRWRNGVMQDLGALLPAYEWSEGRGVSWNGTDVVGWVRDDYFVDFLACRWAGGVTQPLSMPSGGTDSEAWDISANGSVIVGQVYFEFEECGWVPIAFRWSSDGRMQSLGTLGGCWSEAFGVSANGSVVVGISETALYEMRAFRWENGVMENIGTLPGYDASQAESVSADGSVIVGVCWAPYSIQNRYRAFRWQGVMQDLGKLSGPNSWAYDVSADGLIVVGWADLDEPGYPSRAVRWLPRGGRFVIEDLNITYAHLLRDGSVLEKATAISPNGRYIVGEGYNATTGRREAFLLDTRLRVIPIPIP
jgi:probable HAF family extracellular repeat protein